VAVTSTRCLTCLLVAGQNAPAFAATLLTIYRRNYWCSVVGNVWGKYAVSINNGITLAGQITPVVCILAEVV